MEYRSGALCAEVVVHEVAASQFATRKEISLSAASIRSIQNTADSTSAVKNDNGIVVGRWVGDAVRWTIEDEPVSTPIRVCIAVEAPEQKEGESKLKYFDFVETTDTYESFMIRGLNVPITSHAELCVDLVKDSLTIFPAAYARYISRVL